MAGQKVQLRFAAAAAGFAFVLLASAVVWLGIKVVDLQTRVAGEVEVVEVETAAVEAEPPPLPNPVRPVSVPPPTPVAADDPSGLGEDAWGEEVDPWGDDPPPFAAQPRTVLKGIPTDPVTGKQYEVVTSDDPKGNPPKVVMSTEKEILERLAQVHPEAAKDRLSDEEIEGVQTTFCTKFRPESALGSTIGAHTGDEYDAELYQAITAAVYEKWLSVTIDAPPEAFARADERVMERLEELLTPAMFAEVQERMKSDRACEFIPGDDVLQKHAHIFRLLTTRGFRETLEETQRMTYGLMTPPAPEGMDPNDANWKRYQAKLRKAFENPERERAPVASGDGTPPGPL